MSHVDCAHHDLHSSGIVVVDSIRFLMVAAALVREDDFVTIEEEETAVDLDNRASGQAIDKYLDVYKECPRNIPLISQLKALILRAS